MYIDIHSHAYWKPTPFVTRFFTPEELIEVHKLNGIEKGVLLPVVNCEIYLPQTNEDILDMAEIIANTIAMVYMQREEFLDIL